MNKRATKEEKPAQENRPPRLNVYCDLAKCLGCQSCRIACALEHSQSKDIYSALKEKPLPRARIFLQVSEGGPYPLQCRHCEEPACVLACMSAGITRDAESGVVTINKERCVACGMCIMACPFGAIIMDPDKGVSIKCDLCIESGEPVCVKVCPTKCLFFGTLEEFKAKCKRSKALKGAR